MLKKITFPLLLAVSLLCFAHCKKDAKKKDVYKDIEEARKTAEITSYRAKVLRKLPHPGKKQYTQGFEIHNGFLYESTGQYDQSSIKKIDLKDASLLASEDIDAVFAEGLTFVNDKIIMLTYKRGVALKFNPEDLAEEGVVFSYETEGWGLTNDSVHLIMSDGSEKLYFRDILTFEKVKELSVTYNGKPLYYLNELEFANGIIYANVFGRGFIVGIDPRSGKVVEAIDASHLSCAKMTSVDPEAVLNGIAYNRESNTFYLTGKNCPDIFEVVFE